MKFLASVSVLVGISAAHGIVKTITVDGNVYAGFDPRFDFQYNQKRIEWGFSSKSSAQGIGPVNNVTSPDMTCRFSPITPPALTAVARAGSDVAYKWTDYPGNHKGPILTYMGRLTTPSQKPSEVEFFKIHETTYDPKTGIWGSDELRKNNMTWKVQIPSDLKAGDYIIRHELVALHYAQLDNRAEFYISCLNVKVLGDGTAEPKGVRFPGAYKATNPGLKINIYYGENRYVSPGPKVYNGQYSPPIGSRPIVKETGIGSGPQWEAYKKIKDRADKTSEGILNRDDIANPGGGGCHWEPGTDASTAVCTPRNGGHAMSSTPTNAYGQFDLKPNQAKGNKAPEANPMVGMPAQDHAAMMKGMKVKRGMERKLVVW